MAYDLALNVDSWDLAIDDGDLILTDGAERIAQQILITLRFWYGEWFLDTEDGTPYLEYILVKNPNISHIKQILSERILKQFEEDSEAIRELQRNAQKSDIAFDKRSQWMAFSTIMTGLIGTFLLAYFDKDVAAVVTGLGTMVLIFKGVFSKSQSNDKENKN